MGLVIVVDSHIVLSIELHCGPNSGCSEASGDTWRDIQSKVWSGRWTPLRGARQTGMESEGNEQLCNNLCMSCWIICCTSFLFQRFNLGVKLYYKIMEAMLKSVLYFLFPWLLNPFLNRSFHNQLFHYSTEKHFQTTIKHRARNSHEHQQIWSESEIPH